MKLKTKFQDEYFKLGEVVDVSIASLVNSELKVYAKSSNGAYYSYFYESVKDFTDYWEDAPEEPKEHWYIDCDGEVLSPSEALCNEEQDDMKEIGNYFGTGEEAEKAVEKLKAWKRLKDSGFRVNNWVYALEGNRENGSTPIAIKAECKVKTPYKDLDLLFSGEDE